MTLYVINDAGYRLLLAECEAIQKDGAIFVMRGGEPKRLPLEPDDISVSQAMCKAGIAALGQAGVEGLLTRIYQAMHAASSKETHGDSTDHGKTDDPLIPISLTEKYCRQVDEVVQRCRACSQSNTDGPSGGPSTGQ